ncbi:Holliday junction resolvase RecU ['Camptotheca acuminata' phytoplasma]|uniref:Holliday junction resolvase RecU n=1 Tax='Camptotheca acuminata' phytoplasma TaxID=3239192 RepID=UPI00351A740F
MFQYPYPFFKKKEEKKILNKSGLGNTLEKDIILTNAFYKEQNIALVFKNEISIQVVKTNYPSRQKAKITEAYYHINSLPDYQGIYRGKYICFDVKETNHKTSFSLKNIPQHQINNLEQIKKFKGIAFFIINFKQYDKYFYLPIDFLTDYIANNKKKSINYKIFVEKLYQIPFSYRPRLDYIKIINYFI